MVRAALQGFIDLANGRLQEARAQFQLALARKDATPTYLTAQLGMTELEMASNRPAAAMQQARLALQTAAGLQGGLPYSFRTGLAWLALARASQQLGDRAQASKAFETSIVQLSNTVDADHPALLQARHLMAALNRP